MLDAAPRPDVDFIRGLSPVIAIAQRTGGNTNPRSTVATLTEIADHARPLWIIAGDRRCLAGRPPGPPPFARRQPPDALEVHPGRHAPDGRRPCRQG